MNTKRIILVTLLTITLLPLTANAASTTLGSGTKGDDPVLYLNFDESGGPTAYDKSGNNNNGTLGAGISDRNPAWSPSGKYGGCLNFDGTNDYVYIGLWNTTTALKATTGDWSYSAWIKTSNNGNVIMCTDTGDHVRLAVLGDKAIFSLRDYSYSTTPTVATSTTNVSDGNWHHIAGVWSGDNNYIYVDGVQEGSNSGLSAFGSLSMPSWSGSWVIGAQWDSCCSSSPPGDRISSPFTGLIDDLRIYNYARTPNQIKQDYAAGAAALMGGGAAASYDPWDGNPPVAWWQFDEYTGTTAYDRSGNNNNGTITGATWAHGKYGSCLSFDGSNDYVDCGNNSSLQTFTAITLEAWVYPTSFTSYTTILGKQTNYYYGIKSPGNVLYLRHSNLTTGSGGTAGWTNVTLSSNLATNKWHHIAVTWNGDDVAIYLDGEYKGGESGVTGTISNTVDGLAIGNYVVPGDGGHAFPGRIDEVKIYNYARTQAQIAWDYNKGKPVAWWKFDEVLSGAANGQSIIDGSGNDNHGTADDGANNTGMTWTTGKFGGALSFDGADDYVELSPESKDIDVSSAGAITAWIKLNSTPSAGNLYTICSEGGTVSGVYGPFHEIYNVDGYPRLCLWQDGDIGQWTKGTTNFSNLTGQWIFTASVWDGTTAKIYVNGNLETNANRSGSTGNGNEWGIGRNPYSDSRNFNGLIDDVRIYNYARTANQIKQDYQAGAAVHLGGAGISDGSSATAAAKSCKAIKDISPSSTDGTYWIDPDGGGGSAPFQAYCDMTTDGGGWTVIQSEYSAQHKNITQQQYYNLTETIWAQNQTQFMWHIHNSDNSEYAKIKVKFNDTYTNWKNNHTDDSPNLNATWDVYISGLVNETYTGIVRAVQYGNSYINNGINFGLHYKRTNSGEHFPWWSSATGNTTNADGYSCNNSGVCGYSGGTIPTDKYSTIKVR